MSGALTRIALPTLLEPRPREQVPDALYEYGIDDGVLVARAREDEHILLSSDAGIFKRVLVRDGRARSRREGR